MSYESLYGKDYREWVKFKEQNKKQPAQTPEPSNLKLYDKVKRIVTNFLYVEHIQHLPEEVIFTLPSPESALYKDDAFASRVDKMTDILMELIEREST